MSPKLDQSFLDLFEKYQVFLIHAHTNPDPDSIGSVLALKLGLESLGKVVYPFCEDNLEDIELDLPGFKEIKRDSLQDALTIPHDAYLCVDTAAWKLATYHLPIPVFTKPVIVIDHHQDNYIASKYSWIDPSASSACEMVYKLFLKLKIKITKDIASCLIFGMLGDTGIFQNINTTPQILEIVSKLIKAGGDYRSAITTIGWSFPFQELKAWPVLLKNLKISENGKYVWTAVSFEDWQSIGYNFPISGFANTLIRKVTGTNFGAVLVEKKQGVTSASLRSRFENIDVSQIAHHFGGGGHMTAPAFKLNLPIQQAEYEFLKIVHELEAQGKL